LREVSSSRPKGIEVAEVDLSQLLGGTAFTLSCTVSNNGLGIKTSTLIDTGANGHTFIDKKFVRTVERYLGVPPTPLKIPCKVRGFDGQQTTPITHSIELALVVDGRRIRTPMLIVGLGEHDMILGRKWFAQTGVLIDCKNRRLIWPEDAPQAREWGRLLTATKKTLESTAVNPLHQEDADRRDRNMSIDLPRKPVTLLRRPASRATPTWKKEQAEQYRKMRNELKGTPQPKASDGPGSAKRRPITAEEKQSQQPIDICSISAAAFRLNLRKKENVCFATSIFEIDRELEARAPTRPDSYSKGARRPEETEVQWLARTLPSEYAEYADVFSREASNVLPPHRAYDHKIHIEDPKGAGALGYSPLRSHSTHELQVMKRFLEENLQSGLIEPSQAPFASPVLFVKKPHGGLRFCVDYRKLNDLTRKDRYPLPLIAETLARLSKAKVYTKLDICQAFHRIRMDPDSEELTTFRTRYGAYKCKVLWEGLTNAPATYQRYMNDILLEYIDDFCTVYLDDILVYSEDPLEHTAHVKKVLDRLRAAGLQADINKSEFRVTRTKYLGFIVSTEGIEVDPDKVAVVRDWKPPSTVKGVQGFLGFCNFYRRFIKEYGRIAKALNALTRKGTVFKWTEQCQEAFDLLKRAVLEAPILHFFDYDLPTMVEADASNGVVAGVLSQQDPQTGRWHPVAFFSKTMQPAELNYDIHDKEMLAVVLSLDEWRAELEGLQTPFLVYSDHRALEYFMTTKKLSARQARWAEYLSRFHFKLAYRAGKSNERADALSRRTEEVAEQARTIAVHRTQILLPRSKVTEEVAQDLQLAPIEPDRHDSIELVDRLLTANRAAPELEELRAKARNEKEGPWGLRNGLLLREGKLYVPDAQLTPEVPLRTALIKEAHEQPLMGHPGRAKLRQLVQSRYYWPNQGKDIDQYRDNCHTCKRSHVPRDKKPGLLHPLPVPGRPWQHVSVDFKKCPESKKGYNMVAIFVDRLGKRPVTIPVRDTITARELAPLFLTHVVRHVGVPESIVSDRGPQFVSDFWDEFCTRIGTKLKLSTANHPQTDGQTEVVNQYFDQRLRPYVNYYQDDWDEWVAIIDYQQAALWHETTGQSPFLTEKGYEPRTSFDWEDRTRAAGTPKERLNREEAKALVARLHDSWQQAQKNMAKAQERHAAQANKHRREPDFGVGDKVWVTTKHWKSDRPSKKLANQMEGPYEILEQVGHSFKLKLPASMKIHPVFHAEKLRKDASNPLPGQANPEPIPLELEDGELEYEVQEVLAVKLVRGKLQYRIQWKGWDPDPEWYPASALSNSPLALRNFHAKYPARPGPPANLQYWLDCAEKDEYPEARQNDNLPRESKRR
jgi:transposase InsO family protein/predicted aspartyl protease